MEIFLLSTICVYRFTNYRNVDMFETLESLSDESRYVNVFQSSRTFPLSLDVLTCWSLRAFSQASGYWWLRPEDYVNETGRKTQYFKPGRETTHDNQCLQHSHRTPGHQQDGAHASKQSPHESRQSRFSVNFLAVQSDPLIRALRTTAQISVNTSQPEWKKQHRRELRFIWKLSQLHIFRIYAIECLNFVDMKTSIFIFPSCRVSDHIFVIPILSSVTLLDVLQPLVIVLDRAFLEILIFAHACSFQDRLPFCTRWRPSVTRYFACDQSPQDAFKLWGRPLLILGLFSSRRINWASESPQIRRRPACLLDPG